MQTYYYTWLPVNQNTYSMYILALKKYWRELYFFLPWVVFADSPADIHQPDGLDSLRDKTQGQNNLKFTHCCSLL